MGQIWVLAVAGVVLLLMALVVVDRVSVSSSGHSRLPWRRHRTTRLALSTGLDQVTALFYATKHYELDQRRAEIMLRDETDDAAPPRHGLRDGGVFVLDPGRRDPGRRDPGRRDPGRQAGSA
ncbi:DUF6191 domain-containing protein [Pseudonocardia dioxanivorans]|uniref:DUF6191 domain-containing protein n=1 Tax=Pseudonocardia dioxanivorans TaxID=240495 RepID=UPI000CCFE431|nr:DUF6191 domain-containing protein [Pseudonocardia dioxanivorans]